MRGGGEEEPIRAAQTDAGKRPISETEAPADEPQGRRWHARQAAELAVDEPTATEPSAKLEDSKADAMMSAQGGERTKERREHHSSQRSRRTTRRISTAMSGTSQRSEGRRARATRHRPGCQSHANGSTTSWVR